MQEELMKRNEQPDPEQVKALFTKVVSVLREQGVSPEELLGIYEGAEPDKRSVPIGIFAGKLSPSEALCKYLKENLALSYKEISELLNRDERSIWTSHNRAKEKMPEQFAGDVLRKGLSIPIEIFSNRELSILENLVLYLREHTDETNYGIAKLLNKTPSMIYTIYNRAKAKAKPARPKPVKPEKEEARPAKRKRLDIRDYIK